MTASDPASRRDDRASDHPRDSARPDLYRRYRGAEQSAPSRSQPVRQQPERLIKERVAKEMSIDPSLTKEQALVRVTEGREGRKILREYSKGREATIKSASAVPVDVNRAKVEAHRRLQDAISKTMAEKHVDKAQATVRVCKSETGQRDYQVMLGLVAPDKPPAPWTAVLN